ncbi:hypothetical protein FOH10_31455 [Nocardia otitidiscaviarum]|uniref:Uncharacterized protein n=1 Tax=Nocardia otitidiscaviarum TaxID=1823 RepID=A0A516NUI5_9NOCA|nr:hypothetical protein [Nocardia otitidiscaviarum]MCP9621972.1 hypothetical protein [Nocardia otitidiscaviarum]QDP82572.1 hypothetical protein FOH10_31455 [Nocardia otitidiscaviarum]
MSNPVPPPDDPMANRRRTNKMILALLGGALLVVLLVVIIGAVSSEESDTAATSCSASHPISDPDLAAAVEAAALPEGVQVLGGRVTKMGNGEAVGVAVDICAPQADTADALRPIATQLAKAVKATPLSERAEAMWVENFVQRGGEAETLAEVKDSQFKSHLWNGEPSPEAEQQAWEVLTD